MKEDILEKVLNIGIAFSKERDRKRLLEQLLSALMNITNCECGTVYMKKDGWLEFEMTVSMSEKLCSDHADGEWQVPPIALTASHICAHSAREHRMISIADVSESAAYANMELTWGKEQMPIRSMIAIPFEDERENTIGVVQLLNARDEAGNPTSFLQEYEEILKSIVSQAAICLVNINYAQQICEMLDSYVKVMSTAIDARTPYNANHTKNMVKYAKRFIAWLREQHGVWRFDEKKIQAFIMCVWLHDIGKLVTPLEIMDKQDRLAQNYAKVMNRLEKIGLLTRIAQLEGKMSAADAKTRMEQIQEAKQLVDRVNVIEYLTDDLAEQVLRLATYTYEEEDGRRAFWITEEEKEQLLIRKGTLTQSERLVMQEHVEMTRVMLEQMTFGDDYKDVLVWAPQHHELLNGTGYPLRRKGKEICFEVRLLTILDVFEAMTALDRPYKQPMRVEHAFQILHGMADEGAIDADLLNLFEQSRAWEETQNS